MAYRFCLHQQIVKHQSEIDMLEIPTEDYIVRSRQLRVDRDLSLLRDAMERFPSVAHGISMSIGSVEPTHEHYLRSTLRFLQEQGFTVFSEHLAWQALDGKDLTCFLSMPFEESALLWLQQVYATARRFLGRPFALENVTYTFPIPHCSLDEAHFLTRLTELTDCTLLIDVTNVFNNATNHGYDPVEFIRALPGDRISQLHLAGGHQEDGVWIDSHCHPVMEPVWELLEVVLDHTVAETLILERDDNFKPFNDSIMGDIRRARETFYKYRPENAPGANPPWHDLVMPDVPEVSFDDPKFSGLRNFQRALFSQITGDAQPKALDPEWKKRLDACDQKRVGEMRDLWSDIERSQKQLEDEYRRMEWEMWAAAQR